MIAKVVKFISVADTEEYELVVEALKLYDVKINLKDFHIPKCLDMIKPKHVIEAIESYYEGGALKYGSSLPYSVPAKALPYYEGTYTKRVSIKRTAKKKAAAKKEVGVS